MISRIVLSSWFLALFPSLILIWFLPRNQLAKKYSIAVETFKSSQSQVFYIDLNGDSITELIDVTGGKPLNNIHVTDNDLRVYEQWNLPDTFVPGISTLYFGNYDRDSYKEIYVFTVNADSVFLNVIEFFEPSGLRLERVFITTITLVQNEVNSNLSVFGAFDENGDRSDELYFGITTGFGLAPRLIYSFDLANEKISTSPYTSINVSNPVMADVDGDHRPEIFGNTSASGNHHFKTPFSDYSAWLMVLDHQLQFKFPPMEFPGFGNDLDVEVFNDGGENRYVVSQRFFGADTSGVRPAIGIYSAEGKLLKERLNSEFGLRGYFEAMVLRNKGEDQLVLVDNPMLVLNGKLEVLKTVHLSFHSEVHSIRTDLNEDNENELLIFSESEGKLVVYSSDLEELDEHTMQIANSGWQISHYKNGEERKLFLKSGDGAYFLMLTENSYYFAGYLVYPGIYMAFLFFIQIIRKINTYQVEKREHFKRRLITLQLQSVKGQLNPHFTFNALNSVAALLYLDDRKSAYDHLISFTRLLRQILSDADRIYRSVKEEVEFVTVYLDLEKLRFGDKFNYEIEVGRGVTQEEQVPILVLQTFAENAIKHGLMQRTTGGLLRVKVERENDYLKLTIEDNGIGRAKAAELNPAVGKGLKITSEFYEILNQMNSRAIRYDIIDLYDEEGKARGTRVEVWAPDRE